jgi:hypothetical protein
LHHGLTDVPDSKAAHEASAFPDFDYWNGLHVDRIRGATLRTKACAYAERHDADQKSSPAESAGGFTVPRRSSGWLRRDYTSRHDGIAVARLLGVAQLAAQLEAVDVRGRPGRGQTDEDVIAVSCAPKLE